MLGEFRRGGNSKSHVWFRFYNELPVIVLLVVLYLVVLKPF
ncbi:MAG: CopD family protein [Azonexus sp.]